MAFMTDEEKIAQRKIYNKTYREKTIIRLKAPPTENNDKFNETRRAYVAAHKEQVKQYLATYYQSEKGKKSNRVSKWKQMGIKSEDYDILYDRYIATTNCETCNVELCSGNTQRNCRVLDHNHTTGQVRNILCKICNLKIR